MSCYVKSLKGGKEWATPVNSIEEYRALRNDAGHLALLQQIRQETDKAKRDELKNLMLTFYHQGLFPNGWVQGSKDPSDTISIDIDDRDAFERAKVVLLADPERYGLVMLERSISQGGHAVFLREKGKTILENQVRIAMMLHVEMDCNNKNANRRLYATSASEEDLLYVSPKLFNNEYNAEEVAAERKILEERERKGLEEVPEGAHSNDKHYRPWEHAWNRKDESSRSVEPGSDDETEEALEYEGIPYARIIDAYWDVANGSETPTEGSRDTKTFHLAKALGPICNYDRELMAKVIPCYDGFTEQEKMKCIDSAREYRDGISPDLKKALDMIHRQEETTDYAQRLPKLPMGVRDSVGAVGPHLALPAIVGTCPAIGALATGVKLEVHGELKNLNLVSYIAGEFASGKGRIDPVIGAWMAEMKANDLPYLEQEAEWREKKRGAKNKKEQPEEPKLPVRYITLNSTVAKLADRLGNTGGKHAYSFTSEGDMVANRLSSEGIMNYSILLRNAYDGSAYEREARSVDATNVHIDHLLWNVTMCGTPDALYRVVRNTMDGLQSRIAVAKMPDNTFAPLEEKPYVLTDVQEAHIHQVAHLLMLMNGNLVLPKLEERGRKWVERVRLESMKNDDRAQARQRMRICVTAQRMTCCLMLCLVAERLIKMHGYAGAEQRLKESPSLLQTMMEKAQTSRLLGVYDVLADSLLENALYYFRDRIEKAYTSGDYGGSSRCYNTLNGTIYDRLDVTFTREQLTQQVMLAKGGKATRNSIYQMLKNWKKQGLVEFADEGKYRKLLSA